MNNDLISRSALLQELDLMEPDEDLYEYEHDVWLDSRLEVAHAPAVDAEVVRHGRWMPYYEPMECFVDAYLNTEIRDVHMGWICSECGRYEQHGTTEEMPYCHCGAKMDAEVQDGTK